MPFWLLICLTFPSNFPKDSSCDTEEERHSVFLAINKQRDGHIYAGVWAYHMLDGAGQRLSLTRWG